MKYYRCKCGKAEAWGSMHPVNCVGCTECNTTLELAPDRHRTPEGHRWESKYDEDTGELYQRCAKCGARKEAEGRVEGSKE